MHSHYLAFALFAILMPVEHAFAALVLGPPGVAPDTGFFDGYSGDLLGGVSAAQLPEKYGVAGIKVFGTAAAVAQGENGAYMMMMAIGGVNDSPGLATILQVNYVFNVSVAGVPWIVEGLAGTSAGGFYGSANGIVPESGVVTGSFFLEGNGGATIPAGTMIEAWYLGVFVGEYGSPEGPASLTLTIPHDSVDLIAYGTDQATGAVPEPATWILLLSGCAVLVMRLRGGSILGWMRRKMHEWRRRFPSGWKQWRQRPLRNGSTASSRVSNGNTTGSVYWLSGKGRTCGCYRVTGSRRNFLPSHKRSQSSPFGM